MKIKINRFLPSTAAETLIFISEKNTRSCTWESERYYYCLLNRSAFPPCKLPLTEEFLFFKSRLCGKKKYIYSKVQDLGYSSTIVLHKVVKATKGRTRWKNCLYCPLKYLSIATVLILNLYFGQNLEKENSYQQVCS